MLNDELLSVWLQLTNVIDNERLVEGMPFNEALVCGLLSGGCRTASELCAETRILKSQMNAILRSLEGKGVIARERSQTDRRCIELRLLPEGCSRYADGHRRALVEDVVGDGLAVQEGRIAELDGHGDDLHLAALRGGPVEIGGRIGDSSGTAASPHRASPRSWSGSRAASASSPCWTPWSTSAAAEEQLLPLLVVGVEEVGGIGVVHRVLEQELLELFHRGGGAEGLGGDGHRPVPDGDDGLELRHGPQARLEAAEPSAAAEVLHRDPYRARGPGDGVYRAGVKKPLKDQGRVPEDRRSALILWFYSENSRTPAKSFPAAAMAAPRAPA